MFEQYSEEEYEEMFKKVKECINMNPGRTKYEIARKTGISIDIINKFIEEGRLEEKLGSMGYRNVNRSNMSEERRKKLTEELRKQLEPSQSKMNECPENSRLVSDLKEKFNRDIR